MLLSQNGLFQKCSLKHFLLVFNGIIQLKVPLADIILRDVQTLTVIVFYLFGNKLIYGDIILNINLLPGDGCTCL